MGRDYNVSRFCTDIYPPQEFIESATQALLELLHHYKMGNELWVAALWNTYSLLDRWAGHPRVGGASTGGALQLPSSVLSCG